MYRSTDFYKITENIDKIIYNINQEKFNKYEPTFKEMSEVYSTIKNYIKKTNKIIYGGFAQNYLLKKNTGNGNIYHEKDEAYYKLPDFSIADIDFYSSNPLEDLIILTEEVYKLKYKHQIEGKEGIHSNTYKIFVNTINYCDITYIDPYIFNNMQILEVDGFKFAHPHFMLVDAYRVLSDPIMSNWRLDKPLKFQKILVHYPIDVDLSKTILLKTFDPNIIKYICNKIIHKSKLIVVGFFAFNYYVSKILKEYVLTNIPYYEVISTNYKEDAEKILKILKNKYDNISTREFHPFMDITSNRIEYYYKNQLVLILYDNNDRCIIYNYSNKKKIYFGKYTMVYLFLLIRYHLFYIKKDTENIEIFYNLIGKLNYARNKYLDDNDMTVLDNSPFQEFTFECFGNPVDYLRVSRIHNKFVKKFKYVPSGKPGKIPAHAFFNNSAKQILDKKYLVLKKK
jgi:hypothetical protein